MARPISVLLGVLLLLLTACTEMTAPPQAEADAREGERLTALAATGGVFFSEYIEGSSNDKALEIFNATGAAVDLGAAGYKVQMYFNGSIAAGLTVNLTGSVAAGDVLVVAHSSADPAILAQADQTNGAGWFNGNDAVVLSRGSTVLDVIGQIGADPGTEWGSGLVSTGDNTLRRKASVCAGDPGGSDAFDPATEWDGFATNTFDGLGSHSVDECDPVGDEEPGGGDEEPDSETCDTPATLIHEIQGIGGSSPLSGEMVTIEGIVVGDFQRGDGDEFGTNLGGFHVQEEDADADADPLTSEGIYVFHSADDVAVGDKVRVRGTVSEFNGMTEIAGIDGLVVCASEVELPTAAVIELPLTSLAALEAFEGMRVTFPQGLFVSEYFDFDRFGEIVLSAPIDGGRPYQPTASLDPADAGIADAIDLLQRSRILLDDGRSNQNPDPARHPNGEEFTLENSFRGGDVVTNLTGVLDYAFGRYRVQPTQGADYTAANPRPQQPDVVGGSLRAAAFNVLNYFVRFTSDGDVCGTQGDEECRGADDLEEFLRQRDKIVAALATMDAHVVGLIEIENDPDQAAVADLVASLNAVAGAGTYAYVDTQGPVGSDVIKVALIYQPAFVNPVGAPAILDTQAFVDPNRTGEDRNRAALAQTFEEVGGGAFTAVVNHFKSKGSGCGAGDDDPLQGNCNLTRVLAAQALLEWLETDPTAAGDPDYLLVGDFNSYDHEQPIDVLRAGGDGASGTGDGYTDLLRQFVGEDAYTYVFDGQLGYLDYALASASLTPQVTGATAWHINADEPDLIDYDMSFKADAQDALYAPDPFRSSDHDPVIVGLDLNAAPSCNEATASVTSLWPVNHKLIDNSLSVSDPENDPVTIAIDSIYQDEPVLGDDDGDTSPDALIRADGSFALRAERDGEGNGRVYHVAFTASDATGSCAGVVRVGAPLSRGGAQPFDDGALYDSTLP